MGLWALANSRRAGIVPPFAQFSYLRQAADPAGKRRSRLYSAWRYSYHLHPNERLSMAANSLRGRTALVTGGSRGIGAAVVRALAEAGAAVAINYRERADAANALAKHITGA